MKNTSFVFLLLFTVFLFSNCGPQKLDYHGTVFSKNEIPVPNTRLDFLFMIGSKETNTETRSVITDASGQYVLTGEINRSASLHEFRVFSDSGTYNGPDPQYGKKSDLHLK